MSRSIQLDSDGNDITCMKEFDALKYPCDSCERTDCEEREMNENMDDFWWDYNLMKRKMYCPECGGTGKYHVTIGGKCPKCGGTGEVVLENEE